MKVCGVEISGSEARLIVLEKQGENVTLCTLELKRISLKDDEQKEQVRSFFEVIQAFVRENQIQKIAIKKRMKTGGFASGPVSFKIEAIFQLLSETDVVLIAAATIAAYERKNEVEIPAGLNKYQTDAFRVAYVALMKA